MARLPLIVALFSLVVDTVGCRGGQLAAPCDEITLAKLTVECRTEVRAKCARDAGVVDEACPTLQACDQRVRSWLACHVDTDAGAPVSGAAGGAS